MNGTIQKKIIVGSLVNFKVISESDPFAGYTSSRAYSVYRFVVLHHCGLLHGISSYGLSLFRISTTLLYCSMSFTAFGSDTL